MAVVLENKAAIGFETVHTKKAAQGLHTFSAAMRCNEIGMNGGCNAMARKPDSMNTVKHTPFPKHLALQLPE